MEQGQRKTNFKKTLIILLVILVILLILIWWFFWRGQILPGQQANENTPVYNKPSANINYEPTTADKVDPAEFDVQSLALMYAERLGSWSTDNQLKNLQQLIPLSSQSMKNYLNSQEVKATDEFYGVTTNALNSTVVSQTDSSAVLTVSTQRIENKAGQQNTFYQDLRIEMVKSGDTWLVSGAYWQ